METVKVAAVQAAPVLLDRDATVEKAVGLTEQAAAEGARLVVFPEAFVPGYPDWVWRTRPWEDPAAELHAQLLDQAVVADSPATDALSEAAQRLDPLGEILAGPLVGAEGIIYADVDAGRARAARDQFDVVGHYSRPDVFHLSTDTAPRSPVTFTGAPAADGAPERLIADLSAMAAQPPVSLLEARPSERGR